MTLGSLPAWLKAIVEFKPRILFGFWLLGLFLLVLPAPLMNSLGIGVVRASYRGWIATGTLAAFVFWIVQLVPGVRGWFDRRRARREVLAAIGTLSSEEIVIMAYCWSRQRQTITLGEIDRDIAALVEKGLMVPATQGSVLQLPHTIPRFVWKYICDNPDRLLRGMKPDDPRLQQAFVILESRMDKYDRW